MDEMSKHERRQLKLQMKKQERLRQQQAGARAEKLKTFSGYGITAAIAIAVLLVGLYAFGSVAPNPNPNPAPEIVLPSFAFKNAQTKKAYTLAFSNQELLSRIPCYCGCSGMGHKDIKQCFINASGGWDEHASNCHICQEITLEAAAMNDLGTPLKEIRDSIDTKYGALGNPTPTPAVE